MRRRRRRIETGRQAEISRVDIRTPEDEVLEVALDALRRVDEQTDRERIRAMLDSYRAGGLATIGTRRVRAALEIGQVDRVFVPAAPTTAAAEHFSASVESSVQKDRRGQLEEHIIEELVTLARRTDAAVTFIEDAKLLEPAGGVGATLRFLLRPA